MTTMESQRDRPTTTFPPHAFYGLVHEDYGSDQPVHSHLENTTLGRNDEVADTGPNRTPGRQMGRQDHQQTAQPTVPLPKVLASVDRPKDSGDSSAIVQFSRRDPNEIYQPVYSLGQTGDTIISYHRTRPVTDAVAIRKTAMVAKNSPRILKQPLHKNIARAMEGFYHEESRFVVYECMDLSLEDVMAAPVVIHEDHVAVICSEVLQGLQYMHETLNHRHGSIKAASILLSISGDIKIGNITESQLKEDSKDFQSDLLGLKETIKGLVDSWSPDATAFLKAIDISSCAELLRSPFLKKHTGVKVLLPLLRMTNVSVGRGWRFCRTLSAASAG
ncbi:hypothetical protein B0J12DRAFT_687084 [Macrophomina phaseolina]|uniref:Protein kinase domain-containing protein n=1 Tax=Macrophomina phaseolina TaxID=35725 RepID=A0ABQ8FSE2_9PEZI|nr:hypothetical protein B0J12DRAFT_687084 [Macrophomina phaseolina]